MTNDPTLAGARFRHAIVESSADKTATAQSMAYLSHLDRADLLAEIERLRGIILSAQAYCDKNARVVEELTPPTGPLNAALWRLRQGILQDEPS